MDLNFTPEEIAFREEARHFFRTEIPKSIRDKVAEGEGLTRDDMITSQRILNARGWATVNWPVEWGGQDWTPIQVYLYQDEMQQANVPGADRLQRLHGRPGDRAVRQPGAQAALPAGDGQCGHLLVPGLLRTRLRLRPGVVAHQGREARATNTSSTARRPGPRWRNTPTGSSACAAPIPRAKAQEGISFILVDMKTPGITVRPIVTIDGGREVNEVFFDNVEVPAENLVGQENKGWDYAKFLLGNERTGIARVGASKAKIARIKELAALEFAGERPLIETPALPGKARRGRSRAEGAGNDPASGRFG